jgi:hypothetical protein
MRNKTEIVLNTVISTSFCMYNKYNLHGETTNVAMCARRTNAGQMIVR